MGVVFRSALLPLPPPPPLVVTGLQPCCSPPCYCRAWLSLCLTRGFPGLRRRVSLSRPNFGPLWELDQRGLKNTSAITRSASRSCTSLSPWSGAISRNGSGPNGPSPPQDRMLPNLSDLDFTSV